MTQLQIMRLASPLRATELPAVLSPGARLEAVPTGNAVQWDEVEQILEEISNVTAVSAPRFQPSDLDQRMASALHRALRPLTRRDAADMRLWHWLCVGPLQDFVWVRWHGSKPGDIGAALTTGMIDRFLGSQSLRGVSRNALARLWWCVDALQGTDGDRLAQVVLGNQDFFVNLFERRFSICRPVARGFVRALEHSEESERREASKLLNHLLTTIVAETLTEEQVVRLLTA